MIKKNTKTIIKSNLSSIMSLTSDYNHHRELLTYYLVHLIRRAKNMSATSRLESLYSVIYKKQNESQNDSSSILLLQQYMELVRLAINEKEIE